MVHLATLLRAEIKALQDANQVKRRRERKQKRHILQGGSLTVEEGEEIVRSTQTQQGEGSDTIQHQRTEGKHRRWDLGNQVRYNAHTCKAPQVSIEVK